MERHKENMEGKQIICGRFEKVMVQAVSKGSGSWVLCESSVLGVVLRSKSSGPTLELFIPIFL